MWQRVYTLIKLICPFITKTCLYKFDPLKPHFYIVKLGFTEVYIIFLISAQNIDCQTLRNHDYSNILKISPPKTESFQIKILILFHISAQNIDCGYLLEPPRQGGSNEYTQSMFWAENMKNIRVFYLRIFSFWRWNFLYIWIGVVSYRVQIFRINTITLWYRWYNWYYLKV